jgi:hypothetical protein
MPALLAMFFGSFFAMSARGILARVLGALGMGLVSYVGVTAAINYAISLLHTKLGGIPSDITNLMGMAGLDVFLSLVISARFGVIAYFVAAMGLKRLSFIQGGN